MYAILRQIILIAVFLIIERFLYGSLAIIICLTWAICFYLLEYIYTRFFGVVIGIQPSQYELVRNVSSKWVKGKQFLYLYIVYGIGIGFMFEPKTITDSFVETTAYTLVPLILVILSNERTKD